MIRKPLDFWDDLSKDVERVREIQLDMKSAVSLRDEKKFIRHVEELGDLVDEILEVDEQDE